MQNLEKFKQIINRQGELALATCVNDIPNIRIVNFIYYNEILYFSTFSNNKKVTEFEQNNKVSFSTIPNNEITHIRVYNGIVKKSNLSIYDLHNEFIKKFPFFETFINEFGDMLSLYQIDFKKAKIIEDLDKKFEIKF